MYKKKKQGQYQYPKLVKKIIAEMTGFEDLCKIFGFDSYAGLEELMHQTRKIYITEIKKACEYYKCSYNDLFGLEE